MKKGILAAVMAAMLLAGCGGTASSNAASKPVGTESKSVSSDKEGASKVSSADSSPETSGTAEDTSVGSGEKNSGAEDPAGDDSAGADRFPSFSTQDLAENSVSDKIFADAKLAVVNVWGTFCGPCIREMPDLGELAKELAGEGVQFLGVVCDVADFDGSIYPDLLEEAKNIVEMTGAGYTHIIPPAALEELLSATYVIPTTYFVDSKGRILGEPYIGSRPKEDWKSIIDEKLAGL